MQEKLENYMRAISQGVIESAYQFEHELRVLCVFSEERSLELVQNRMSPLPYFADFQPVFYAKTLEEVGRDFMDGWRHFDGRRVPLFL